MSIPSNLQDFVNRLNDELTQLEQKTTEALMRIRVPLSQFPENVILIQFFAYLNNVLFFIETYRNRIQRSLILLSDINVSETEVQEIGEDLSAMLGDIIEAQIRVDSFLSRLEG